MSPSSNHKRFADSQFEYGAYFVVSPGIRRHKRFDGVKTLAQGGIHFRRASLIKRGPRGEKPRGEKPGYEEKGAELRAKLGR